MPREELVIATFDKGIISGADQADIAEGAAAWSIDEHPDSIPGTVQPRLTDTAQVDDTNMTSMQFSAWITRVDSKRDIIYYSPSGGSIEAISDFFSAKTVSTVSSEPGTSETVSFTVFNRGVRMGWGNNAAKYIGYVEHGLFGVASAPTTLRYLNSELSNIAYFPHCYKVVGGVAAINSYGIEWQGTKIYKFTNSTGAYVVSPDRFVSLQGICDYTLADDGAHLFVYDKTNNFGVLYKILKSDLSVVETYPLTGWGTDTTVLAGTAVCSDIERSTNKIWFAIYHGTTGGILGVKLLFNYTVSSLSTGTTFIPVDVTPSNSFVDNTIGGFDTTLNFGITNFFFPKLASLIKTKNWATEIQWGCDIKGGLTHSTGPTAGAIPRFSIVVLGESVAAAALWNSTNCRLMQIGGTLIVPSTAEYNNVISVKGDTNYGYVLGGHTTTANAYSNQTIDLASAGWSAGTWVIRSLTTTLTKANTKSLSTNVVFTVIITEAANTATIGFMSAVQEASNTESYGRFVTNTLDMTAGAGTWGTAIAVKGSDLFLILTGLETPVGTMITTKKYYYRAVTRYQDYQGSPLYLDTDPYEITLTGTQTSCQIDVYVIVSGVPLRATGLDIFRAESLSTEEKPTTLYRLVGTIDLKVACSTNTGYAFGTRNTMRLTDTGDYGVSYETEYGVPETLPNNTMDYTVSCSGAGYLFVTQGYNDELDGVANVVFRSKRNAPDTFDWSNDFCVLPTMVNALHYFKGYLYAFENSNVYVIDPENLVLVGKYHGMGTSNALAVISDENAMFFANQDNIFMHDGKTPVIISDPVNQVGTLISGATSHRTLATSYTISLCMMARFNCLVVGYMGAAAEAGQVFVFNLRKRAWYYWQLDSVSGTHIVYGAVRRSIFSDYLGDLYFSVNKGIAKICGSASGKVATWYSKLMELGDNTTLKKIYKATFNGTCDLSIGYNSPSTITTAVTSGSYLAAFATKQTSVQFKAAFTSGEILRGITVILRKMNGLR